MTIKMKKNLSRELTVEVGDDSIELAFASAEPYDRGYFTEVLDMGGMDLTRLNRNAQVLFNHDPSDYVGVVENARLDEDGVARASIRFGSSERAKQVEADVRSGILPSVSFGYRVNAYEERGQDEVVVTSFEPFEISIVTIPADSTVGVGRSLDTQENQEVEMTEEVKEMAVEAPQPVEVVDVEAVVAAERGRVNAINELGSKYGQADMARNFVENGKSIDEFRTAILENMDGVTEVEAQTPEIGLTEKEVRQFSIAKAIRALANPDSAAAQREAAFEFEASQAAADKLGKSARGLMLPFEILARDMSVGTATAGGHTVDDVLMAGSMIDLLRNKSYMMQLANVMTGLRGDISIPRQTGAASAYWVAEDGETTNSAAAFDLVQMSPKSLSGATYATRKLLLQSELTIDTFIQRELATVLALEIDRAAINGSGASNQPTGILNQTGVNAVAIATNGGALTRDAIVDLETAISVANADEASLRFLTNPKVRGSARKTLLDAGSGQFLMGGDNMLLGYDTVVTNQMPSDLTKGSGTGLSGMVFGDFSQLMIGMWSGLDLVVDPYTHAKKGGLEISCFQDIDIAVRNPAGFAKIVDIVA
jgi:HK97 family phage major capsid protein/HK97 family phage prohead protease